MLTFKNANVTPPPFQVTVTSPGSSSDFKLAKETLKNLDINSLEKGILCNNSDPKNVSKPKVEAPQEDPKGRKDEKEMNTDKNKENIKDSVREGSPTSLPGSVDENDESSDENLANKVT